MASVKKLVRNAEEAQYVFTNAIVDFVDNARVHPFAVTACRNPDAPRANAMQMMIQRNKYLITFSHTFRLHIGVIARLWVR